MAATSMAGSTSRATAVTIRADTRGTAARAARKAAGTAMAAEATPVAAEMAVAAAETEAAETAAAEGEGTSPLSFLHRRRGARGDGGSTDVLIVGLGNPGDRYAATRHNVGFEVAAELSRRWGLPRGKRRFGGLVAEGRVRPGGPRVAVLLPQTYMNDSGESAGPARGSLRVPIERTVVVHDEIDLEFGTIRSRLGGGVAGHNGLKSLRQGFGSADFWRMRVGVGRPDSTDPEIVSRYVLSRFAEPPEAVRELIGRAAEETERVIEEIVVEEADPIGRGAD